MRLSGFDRAVEAFLQRAVLARQADARRARRLAAHPQHARKIDAAGRRRHRIEHVERIDERDGFAPRASRPPAPTPRSPDAPTTGGPRLRTAARAECLRAAAHPDRQCRSAPPSDHVVTRQAGLEAAESACGRAFEGGAAIPISCDGRNAAAWRHLSLQTTFALLSPS